MWLGQRGLVPSPPPSGSPSKNVTSVLCWFNGVCFASSYSDFPLSVVVCACWFIWLERNSFIFECSPPNYLRVLTKISSLNVDWLQKNETQFCSVPPPRPAAPLSDEEYLLFFCDGSFRPSSGLAVIGGVIKQLRFCTIVVDNQALVEQSSSENVPPWEISVIIEDIRDLARRQNVDFRFVPRKCNRAAHWLAAKACDEGLFHNWLGCRPPHLVFLIASSGQLLLIFFFFCPLFVSVFVVQYFF